MNQREFVAQADGLERLVRTEFDLTQEKMALVLGLSKKTLVEIEKGRSSLGWAGAVTLCTLFSDSQVLQNAYGGELSDLLKALSAVVVIIFLGIPYVKRKYFSKPHLKGDRKNA